MKKSTESIMKVIELVVENYMGVKAVQIKPVGNVVRVEGKNEAGKSSVIDAIWVTIGGASESGKYPLRNGAKQGRALVDLGDIRVERKFTESGTYLEVSDKDGKRIPRPQEFLDQFYTKTTIDPQNFIKLGSNARRNLLLDLTGKRDEIEELDEQRRILYEDRTLVNREVKTIQGKLAGRTTTTESGTEVPIAGLLKELEASIAADNALVKDRALVADSRNRVSRTTDRIELNKQSIQKLKDEIVLLEQEVKTAEKAMSAVVKRVENATESKTSTIRMQIADAEKLNEVVRRNKEWFELDAQLKMKECESKSLTDTIEGIDGRKTEILQESALAIGTVGFDGDTLLVNGVPFDDLATSRQLLVSLEIAISQNPRIRVVRISNGNVFDEDNMSVLEAWADEHDCQLWIEKVLDSPDGLGFFIKDGSVAE